MSRLSLLAAAFVVAATATACQTQATIQPASPPSGPPRMAKGKLPMSGPMMPKAIAAVTEKAGKPMVMQRSTVAGDGSFALSLEVGIRYMFIVTLVDGTLIQLYAEDATHAFYPWVPLGNSLDGSVALDFGSVTIVNGVFVSDVVLTSIDWDEDGIADFDDDDDDNDGIPDAEDFDIDDDGIEDDYLDTDGDGDCDLVDADDDNDGIPDDMDDDDDGDGVPDSMDDDDDGVDLDGDGDPDGGDDPDSVRRQITWQAGALRARAITGSWPVKTTR